jgi:hypothetical protein
MERDTPPKRVAVAGPGRLAMDNVSRMTRTFL